MVTFFLTFTEKGGKEIRLTVNKNRFLYDTFYMCLSVIFELDRHLQCKILDSQLARYILLKKKERKLKKYCELILL